MSEQNNSFKDKSEVVQERLQPGLKLLNESIEKAAPILMAEMNGKGIFPHSTDRRSLLCKACHAT